MLTNYTVYFNKKYRNNILNVDQMILEYHKGEKASCIEDSITGKHFIRLDFKANSRSLIKLTDANEVLDKFKADCFFNYEESTLINIDHVNMLTNASKRLRKIALMQIYMESQK